MTLSITIAFIAGFLSFLAPCVLPIIPGFLAYLAGASTLEETGKRSGIVINSLFFVAGFSSVFAILGVVLNTILASVASDFQTWLSRIGGAIIIFFGLYLAKVIRISFLDTDHKMTVKKKFSSRYLTSYVFGAAFAAGWTPCVGAALGAILGLAASNPGSAFILLLSYGFGLGVPFIIVALFASQAERFIANLGNRLQYVEIVFGFILVVLGILVFTGELSYIANFSFITNLLHA